MLERKAMESLSIAGREALAVARQAWLLRHDTDAPVTPAKVAEGDAVVVFLHGLFATAGVWRPLRATVTRHRGVHAATLTYSIGPSITEIAARLGKVVRAIPKEARIHLV